MIVFKEKTQWTMKGIYMPSVVALNNVEVFPLYTGNLILSDYFSHQMHVCVFTYILVFMEATVKKI